MQEHSNEAAHIGTLIRAGASRPDHAIVASRTGLWRILEDGLNVCAWPRPLPDAPWRALAEAVEQAPLFENEAAVAAKGLAESIDALVRLLPGGQAREFLAADLVALVETYLSLFGRVHAHAHLDLIDRDACRFYHRDNVGVRMICTYVGPGTEWAPRAALVDPDVDDEQAPRNETGLLVRTSRLRHARLGEVLLLKGKRWPGNQHNGAVHRSPPIEAFGRRRLVLRVDPCAHGG